MVVLEIYLLFEVASKLNCAPKIFGANSAASPFKPHSLSNREQQTPEVTSKLCFFILFWLFSRWAEVSMTSWVVYRVCSSNGGRASVRWWRARWRGRSHGQGWGCCSEPWTQPSAFMVMTSGSSGKPMTRSCLPAYLPYPWTRTQMKVGSYEILLLGPRQFIKKLGPGVALESIQ